MAQMSDLPKELMVEIFSKVPLTSLKEIRCTCKTWNALSKSLILSKIEKQFLGFMMMNSKLFSIQFNLQGIHNNEEVNPSIKQVTKFDKIKISKVFHCDGLLLCTIKDNERLLVWNPYLGETKWILPRKKFHKSDRFALGYDKNRNHKILRLFSSGYEIYDLCDDSWSVYNLSPDWGCEILSHQAGVSVQGNTYFMARKETRPTYDVLPIEDMLLCFDFTSERFGQPMPLPFRAFLSEKVSLSCVGEDKLAVSHWQLNEFSFWDRYELDIWVLDKLDDDPKEISWRKFLKSFSLSRVNDDFENFFIDEEKEVAVVFDLYRDFWMETRIHYQTAHIIGQDGFYKPVNIGEALNFAGGFCRPFVCSYVPSLVQLQNSKTSKRKQIFE